MSNFVKDLTSLPFPKTDKNTIPVTEDPNKWVVATDWNTVCQAMLDMRAAYSPHSVALTDATSIATDASLAIGNVFTVTLGGNRTLANPVNLVAGGTYMWLVTQDGTGSRTLAYGTLFAWPSGTAPTLTTAPGSVDMITSIYDGTKLRSVFTGDVR